MCTIDLCMKRETKVSPEFLSVKSSENDLIVLPAYYLIIWLMKAKKNFEKIAILKTRWLVSFWGVKTHFGKMPLKWCTFRHEKIKILSNICCSFWSNKGFYILSTLKGQSKSQLCERYLCCCQKMTINGQKMTVFET